MEEMTGVKAEAIFGKGNYEYSLFFYGVRRPILIDLVLKPDETGLRNYHLLEESSDKLVADTVVFFKGQKHILWGKAVPLYDIKGVCVGAIESIRDITERKVSEAKIEASLKEKEILLREINHRVKNNLQIINSLYNLQAEKTKNEKVKSILQESQARVKSISLVHEKLYQSRDLAKIDVGEYLRSLVQGIVCLFAIDAQRVAIRIKVEKDIDVGIDKIVNCGLIVNELVTNSYKYAFPDGQAGVISIELCKSLESGYELTVSDNGVGLPSGLDKAEGKTLGLELVGLLANQLGSIQFDGKQGTTVKIFIRDEK